MTSVRIELFRSLFPQLEAFLTPVFRTAIERATEQHVAARAPILAPSERCDGLPFVLRGRVKLLRMSTEGREVLLYRISAGQVCVLSAACLEGMDTMAAVGVAESDTDLLIMRPDDARALIRSNEHFRSFLFRQLAERMLSLGELVHALAFQAIEQRVAAQLLLRGPVLETTQEAFAQELGTVRAVLGRALGKLCRNGWIRLSRGRIEVLNVAALESSLTAPSPLDAGRGPV